MPGQIDAAARQPGDVTGVSALDQGRCLRCGGFMVAERYIDLLDDTGQLEFTAHRCVQCGEVVDATILNNRVASLARQQTPRLAKVA
ncbi:hypothetical protein [Candidatus Nitrospira bockiana]